MFTLSKLLCGFWPEFCVPHSLLYKLSVKVTPKKDHQKKRYWIGKDLKWTILKRKEIKDKKLTSYQRTTGMTVSFLLRQTHLLQRQQHPSGLIIIRWNQSPIILNHHHQVNKRKKKTMTCCLFGNFWAIFSDFFSFFVSS